MIGTNDRYAYHGYWTIKNEIKAPSFDRAGLRCSGRSNRVLLASESTPMFRKLPDKSRRK